MGNVEKNSVRALQLYAARYPEKTQPSRHILALLIKNLCETGSINPRKRNWRKTRTDEAAEVALLGKLRLKYCNVETTPSHSLLLSVYHTDRSISRRNIVLDALLVVICIMSKRSTTNWQYVNDLREKLSCVRKQNCFLHHDRDFREKVLPASTGDTWYLFWFKD
jgi:hypothetical protein